MCLCVCIRYLSSTLNITRGKWSRTQYGANYCNTHSKVVKVNSSQEIYWFTECLCKNGSSVGVKSKRNLRLFCYTSFPKYNVATRLHNRIEMNPCLLDDGVQLSVQKGFLPYALNQSITTNKRQTLPQLLILTYLDRFSTHHLLKIS